MLLNEARERVAQLESAIQRLDFVKKHLNRNASDIKNEIHSNVSRNLECMRRREIALLGQVEQVLGVKEEVLERQKAGLTKMLGVLQAGLTLTPNDPASQAQVKDTLDKLQRMELSPVETPYINFRADHVSFQDSILNYGWVDANGLPLATAFDDPGNPSASLPRHVEEYEDADHHIFYKTVEEVNRQKTSGNITVSIPKLSYRVEDWLHKKLPQTSVPQTELPCGPTALKSRPNSLVKFSGTQSSSCTTPTLSISGGTTPGDKCSLNSWLNTIKQHVEEEEHDFEMIENSCTPQAVMETEIPAPLSDKRNCHLEQHIEKDLEKWLQTDFSRESSGLEVTQDFFSHISKDTQVWLLQACRQLTSLEELKQQDFFHHISREPATWLRSRAHCKLELADEETCTECISDDCMEKESNNDTEEEEEEGESDKGGFFSHISSDLNCWLAKESALNHSGSSPKKQDNTKLNSQQKEMKENYEMWLPSSTSSRLPHELMEKERCSSLSSCITQPKYPAAFCDQEMSSERAQDLRESSFKPLVLPEFSWLLQDSHVGKSSAADINATKDWFGHLAAVEDPKWLKSSCPDTVLPSTVANVKKESQKDVNELSLRPQPNSQNSRSSSSSSSFSSFESSYGGWLLVPQGKKNPLESRQEEESEGWSICSSPCTVSSEQHAKDVATATTYFNTWLL